MTIPTNGSLTFEMTYGHLTFLRQNDPFHSKIPTSTMAREKLVHVCSKSIITKTAISLHSIPPWSTRCWFSASLSHRRHNHLVALFFANAPQPPHRANFKLYIHQLIAQQTDKKRTPCSTQAAVTIPSVPEQLLARGHYPPP